MLIKFAGRVVLGVRQDRADANDVGRPLCARSASSNNAVPSPFPCHPRSTARRASRMTGMGCRARPLRVRSGASVYTTLAVLRLLAQDRITEHSEVGLCRTGSLVHQRKPSKIGIQRFDAAVERLNVMALCELLDPRLLGSGAQSRMFGTLSSLAKRGLGFGGASSAATKAAHYFASRRKTCQSASTLSARVSALSSTNALKLL
jgi:hypothetical protein